MIINVNYKGIHEKILECIPKGKRAKFVESIFSASIINKSIVDVAKISNYDSFEEISNIIDNKNSAGMIKLEQISSKKQNKNIQSEDEYINF